jgi:predicted phage terminase large subunit-like protein
MSPETHSPEVQDQALVDWGKGAALCGTPAILGHTITRGTYYLPRHVRFIDDLLLMVDEGKVKRLILCAPPRHGKSLALSWLYPVWHLGRRPDDNFAVIGYEADFAAKWGRMARDTMEEWGPKLFNVRVNPRSAAADRWDLEGHTGGMFTTGVGGPLLGRGFQRIVVEDPIKNAQEAQSGTFKDNLWNWYWSTCVSRAEPDAAIIVSQQRWAPDDLVGRLLDVMKQGGEQWMVVNLPALAEDDDPLGRKPGEALWPEQWPVEQLLPKMYGPFSQAQYQQRPVREGGNHFQREWFRKCFLDDGEKLYPMGKNATGWRKNQCNVFVTVDLAASEKNYSDYTVFLACAVTPERDLLVLDVSRERRALEKIVPQLKVFCERHEPGWVGIEANGFQEAIANEAMKTQGIPAVRLLKTGSRGKLVRATPAIIMAETGRIFLPALADWKEDFLEELVAFTGEPKNDPFDDQCLAEGTLIETIKGPTPIEDIVPGNLVLTRSGYRKVTAAGMTNPAAEVLELTTDDGHSLVGTKNHPVFVVGKGWVDLDTVTWGDIILTCKSKQPSSTALPSAAIPIPSEGHTASTSRHTRERARSCTCTGKSGSPSTARSPRATRSTTRTATLSTTTLPIWNASALPSTEESTATAATSARKRPSSTSKKSGPLPPPGTPPQTATPSTRSSARRPGKTAAARKCRCAPSAAMSTSASPQGRTPSFAAATASGKTVSGPASTTSSDCVPNAAIPLWLTSTRKRLFAHSAVRCVTITSGARPVYNLTVEDGHEYFANGVLVHNCDALAWACLEMDRTAWAAAQPIDTPPLPRVGPGSILLGKESHADRLNPFKSRKKDQGMWTPGG